MKPIHIESSYIKRDGNEFEVELHMKSPGNKTVLMMMKGEIKPQEGFISTNTFSLGVEREVFKLEEASEGTKISYIDDLEIKNPLLRFFGAFFVKKSVLRNLNNMIADLRRAVESGKALRRAFMNRLFANVCSSNLSKAKLFYTELFGFEVKYNSDWFVHLCDPANGSLELGLIAKDHELVPESARGQSSGIYITLVVDDVDLVYRKAQELKVKIIDPPTPTFYRQKRMLLQDPDGSLLDVSSLIMPNMAFERDAPKAARPSI